MNNLAVVGFLVWRKRLRRGMAGSWLGRVHGESVKGRWRRIEEVDGDGR